MLFRSLDDTYILTRVVANSATWISAGGGTGTFNALTVTTTADIGTDLTVGGSAIIGDSFEMTAGMFLVEANDNIADVIYLHTDGGIAESITLHAEQSTLADAIEFTATLGGITANANIAAANAIALNALDAAGGILATSNTGGFTIANADGPFTLTTGTAAIDIGRDAFAKDIVIGNDTGVSTLTLVAGTGGMTLDADGIVDIVPATDTQAAATGTVNANVGVTTHTGLTTASAATQVFTITNAVCTVGSAILVSASNLGANDAQMTVTRVTPGAGTFDVTLTNNGAAALNGDVIITFWIIAV